MTRTVQNHFRPLDAFTRLGLSGNPFAQRDPTSLIPLLTPSPELLELSCQDWRALSIVGPMGSGKTTAAHQLAALLDGEVQYWRVPEHKLVWPDLTVTAVLIVDEVQRLSARHVRRLMTKARATRLLLVGLVDVLVETPWSERRYSPRPLTTHELLRWSNTLIDAVALNDEAPKLSAADAEALCVASQGNRLRATELAYDYFECLVDAEHTKTQA